MTVIFLHEILPIMIVNCCYLYDMIFPVRPTVIWIIWPPGQAYVDLVYAKEKKKAQNEHMTNVLCALSSKSLPYVVHTVLC